MKMSSNIIKPRKSARIATKCSTPLVEAPNRPAVGTRAHDQIDTDVVKEAGASRRTPQMLSSSETNFNEDDSERAIRTVGNACSDECDYTKSQVASKQNREKNSPSREEYCNDNVHCERETSNVNERKSRKEKSRTAEAELKKYSPVTPTKQKRSNENALKSPITPSHLLDKLSLKSPNKPESRPGSKKLFDDKTTAYQNARRALHGTLPLRMPGRENELNELGCFIRTRLETKTSGTLYISGPPGTGKTASLSTVLNEQGIASEFHEVYINCTSLKSSGSIFSKIVKELGCKSIGKSEKDCLAFIESYLTRTHKMTLLVLDEIDQLDSKKQSILYTIFEWPSKPNSKIILIGIANALDLTDRILPRLHARCALKPKLMHFSPYSKEQIAKIITERLERAHALDVFSPVAIQMLAGKVASVSGDARRALDIGRRVVELVESDGKTDVLKSLENVEEPKAKRVDLLQVVSVLNRVYGTANDSSRGGRCDSFPLQQKIVVCTLLLVLKKARNKDVTVGKLHDVYRRVCARRNLLAVDQGEFVGLCSLIETRGIIRVCGGKKETRLHKVCLNWDEEEVGSVLGDKQLMSDILQDDCNCLGKL